MAKMSTCAVLCLLMVLAIVVSHSAKETIPAVFILGDSTADVGTNTYLPHTEIRADFPPYGIDFTKSRATGRFSNGKNSVDFLAKLFGLRLSPQPFLMLLTLKSHHFQKHIAKGVNFASGGAGLLEVTGSKLNIVPLSEQINQFSTVKGNLSAGLGASATDELLCKSLFFISIGSNDIFGYFLSNSTIPKGEFIAILMTSYSNHINNLYALGARKFGIISVPPVGCCPSQRYIHKQLTGKDGCFPEENDFAQAFYTELQALLVDISSQLPGFKYSLGDGYNMTMDVINNPQIAGFENVDSACCGTGYLHAAGRCNKTASVCINRRTNLFWDKFHPTETAAAMAANVLYGGPTYYVSPINFAELAEA